MDTQPSSAIVVAVGPDGADAALAFAVDEARRTARPVHLVHVVRLAAADAYAMAYGVDLRPDATPLEKALTTARSLAGDDVPVTGELVETGGVGAGLVEHAAGASMLVLQHRHLNPVRRLLTGRTVNKVASRATVPVVAVPGDWSAASGRAPVVTVAAQDATEATPLLRLALEQARSRGASLVVLHAWWLASGYDVVVDHDVRQSWESRWHDDLASVLEPLRREYADVEITSSVRHAPPAEALLDASTASELLVIGRRHHLLPLGSHLGPVARAVLDHAECPVLMSPEAPQEGANVPSGA